MEQDELKEQAPVQPQIQSSGGSTGGGIVSSSLGLLGRLKPTRRHTTPDRLVRLGTERVLSTNPLTGGPITVGELYGMKSNQKTTEVPAEALIVAKAFNEGATLDNMEVQTGLTPNQIQRGVAYLKRQNVDLRKWE